MGNWEDTLRLMLLDHELSQRTSRVDAAKLAETLLDLDHPLLALSQIRSEGRLLVDDRVALDFAGTMWWYARRRHRGNLEDAARLLYLHAKPIALIHLGEAIKLNNFDRQLSVVFAWSHVAALFERPSVVRRELLRLEFTSRRDSQRLDSATVKAHLLFNAVVTALDAGNDSKDCQEFVETIRSLGSATWYFRALLRLAQSTPSVVVMESLQKAYEVAETDHDTDLAYAWFLNCQGDRANATEIVSRLPRFRPELGRENWWDSSFITYIVRLRSLQELLGVTQAEIAVDTNERDEAFARVERVARQLGCLLVQAVRGQIKGDRYALFRSLLFFHNRPVHSSTVDPIYRFALGKSRIVIYGHISELAKAMGASGLCVLRDVVLDLTAGPTATQFTPCHQRQFAQLFYEEEVMSRAQVMNLGLSSTADAGDDDPTERLEACLEIATFLHCVGDHAASEDWIRRASEVSAGAGSHKDYHMSDVAEWLARSVTQIDSVRLVALERFARAVEVSGGGGGPEGAATVLRLLARLGESRAWRLAVEFIDRRVLSVSGALKALVVGGVEGDADPELLMAIYGELYSLIAPSDTSETAVMVSQAFPPQQRREAAQRLMSYVRTNALPSHRRVVARALEDMIQDQGLAAITLTRNLKQGRENPSQTRTLYRHKDGEVETLVQIAERLSDPNHPDQWNPNPEDNNDFDWWAAIRKAEVRDEQHFDSLVARFPPLDYQEVERLARKAEIFLRLGNRRAARRVAERAIGQASDGSWHHRLDGAKKVMAFRSLKRIEHGEGIDRAKEQFSKDLSAGELAPSQLLVDIGDILDFLEVDWPSEAVLEAVNDYLEQVLKANPEVRPYESLIGSVPSSSLEQTLCRFVAQLLAIPAVDVGVAARRVLGKYLSARGKGLNVLLTGQPWWNSIQLEHLLIAVHVGVVTGSPHIADIRGFVESLNHSESLSVRRVAKRVCDDQGWNWNDVTTRSADPVILLAEDARLWHHARMMLDGDTVIAWNLHHTLMLTLMGAGLDEDEVRSEFKRVYWEVEQLYPWRDDELWKRWSSQLHVRMRLNPRVIIGREAAMRIVGRRALISEGPSIIESGYDNSYPIYDARLELHQPSARPSEFQAMEWRSNSNDENAWCQGAGARNWNHYPDSVNGLTLIGERSWFVRPDWKWPREERYRGLVAKSFLPMGKRDLDSAFELTYELYLDGRGQHENQLIVLNNERQLVGPAYRWAAINSNFARELGWHPSTDNCFQWLDDAGDVMVQSTYWKDGWIWIKPPRLEPLGEGWFVTASFAAVEAIRRFAPSTETHLWVERHSHGGEPYQGKWHLRRPL